MVNLSLVLTEVEVLLLKIWADFKDLDETGSSVRIHIPNLAPSNAGEPDPGTVGVVEHLAGLRSLHSELRMQAQSLWDAPPSSNNLRGRIGAALIRVWNRLFWWQTWSLRRYAESVDRVLAGHLVALEDMQRIADEGLCALRLQLGDVSRKLHQAQYELEAARRIEPARPDDALRQIPRSATGHLGPIFADSTRPPVVVVIPAESEKRKGIAVALNTAVGAAAAGSDIIMLYTDAEIYDPRWIEKLQDCAYSADDVGIAGCRLVSADGVMRSAGACLFPDPFRQLDYGSGEKDIHQYAADRDVEVVSFTCVYLKRTTIDKVGLLDEGYLKFFLNTDYCLRAARRGLRTVCCGGLTVRQAENDASGSSPIEPHDIFSRDETAFRGSWEQQLRQTRYTRQIGWHSIFNFPTGYAISSRELASALDRAGVHVAYRYAYGPGTLFPKPEPEISDSALANLIRQRPLTADRVQVVYGQGDVFESNFGAYKIGFTMLETDRIPDEWARQANLMDEVWVPSSFNKQTALDSGVTRPIHIIPLGVNPDYFHPGIAAPLRPDVYTFLSIFEWVERKAPGLLLRAFNDEFRANEPVILLVKTMNVNPEVDVFGEVANLGLKAGGGRVHLALNHAVPGYQLGSLYRSADCFVMASRGEGWGMPVIEAMACGLPVIATNWSAQCDYMNETNAYPLRIDGLAPAVAQCGYYAGFNWAEPSYTHLRSLMRHVFENRAEARAKGAQAARDIHGNWTWDHAAAKIIARLDAIAAGGHVLTGDDNALGGKHPAHFGI